ncbi:MATE family efflux transporter [Lachnospiraceae bacterium 62-35]
MSAKASPIRDMTAGNPAKLILGFALPMLMGLLFQQFYSMMDTIIVGKFLGVDDLAAVGSTAAVNFMINGFVIGLCSGFSIPVAQRFGARDYKDMRRFVANAAWLSILFAIVVTVSVSILTQSILIWMQTPDNIINGAYQYIFFIFLGIPTTFLYNILAGFIRSLGDSKTPVYFLVLSSILNIFLDLFFIVSLKTGVAGAAYATVISQGVSGVLCLLYMKRKFPILKMEPGEASLSGRHIYILCKMGVPMGLQYSITAIGSVVIQTSINTLGSIAVASVTAGQKIAMFFCCPFDALGGTMATYSGQNAGAGKIDRIGQGVKAATLIGFAYSALAFILLFFLGSQIPLLFVSPEETTVIHQAHQFLIYNSMFYCLLTIVNVWRFTIQGMGYSLLAIVAGICEMVGRAFVGFMLAPVFGYVVICFASPLAWLLADAFLIPAFGFCVCRMKQMIEPGQAKWETQFHKARILPYWLKKRLHKIR